ncbi:hypothetical protein Tco_1481075, partial [Tanacetum coccineum]
FMATPIIPISFDSSKESVESSTSWVVMFGTIPTVIPADVSTIIPVVPYVAAAIVASPTGVLDLDVHSTSKTDPFKDLSSPVHAPAAPVISLFYILLILLRHPKIPLAVIHLRVFHRLTHTRLLFPVRGTRLYLHHPGYHTDMLFEIPFGRPYRTHPNRVLRMLTARKRVHPYLTRIPTNHKGFHSSSSSPPRKRHIASSYLSSSDSSSSTTDDSPAPHRFVDPHPSSSGDFSFDSSTSSSKSPPHLFATHSPTPSPSSGPSQKRCRSPTTSVPLATPTPGVLSPACADLLIPHKSIRGFLAASSPKDGSEGSIEVSSKEDIDSDVMANIEANIVAEAAADDEIRAETKVRLERDDEAEDEAESSARGTIEIGVDRFVKPKMPADSLVPANDGGSRENFKIRDLRTLRMSIRRRRLEPWLMNERGLDCDELRQIHSSRYYDKMNVRRLETYAMRRLSYCP